MTQYLTTRRAFTAAEAVHLHDGLFPKWMQSVTLLHGDDGSVRIRAHRSEFRAAVKRAQAAVDAGAIRAMEG